MDPRIFIVEPGGRTTEHASALPKDHPLRFTILSAPLERTLRGC